MHKTQAHNLSYPPRYIQAHNRYSIVKFQP